MTVGKISGLCWTVFVVMSLGFLPLAYGIMQLHAIPTGPRVALMLVVVIAAWWGPFVYGMYLALAVTRNGDRRTLRRGIRGTAEVFSSGGKALGERMDDTFVRIHPTRIISFGIEPGETRARSVHPDLHPLATDEERRALEARFSEISAAYRSLVA